MQNKFKRSLLHRVLGAFKPYYTQAPVICFDMDGVLAEWSTVDSKEDTLRPGYFRTRPADEKAVALLKFLEAAGFQVVILSAVYVTGTAVLDKIIWLFQHGLGFVPRVFVPCDLAHKSEFIITDAPKILIDDYSYNLHDWNEQGGIGIKFLNGINGTKGTWKGLTISPDTKPAELIAIINNLTKVKGVETA